MSVLKKWSIQYDYCIKCGTTQHIHKAKGLCTACYQKVHSYPESICSLCGRLARVHKRIDGKAICRKCYKEPVHTCSVCNKQATAAYKLNSNKFICDTCYVKQFKKKQLCSICGNPELLAINNNKEKICVKCYTTFNNLCSKCGRNVKSPYIIDGKHICSRCYENARHNNSLSNIDISKKLYICSICGKSGIVQRIYNDNSVICQKCHKLQLKICSSCSNPSLPIYSHLNALPYCRNCYYKHIFADMLTKLKDNWSENFSNTLEDYFNSKALRVSYESILEHLKVSDSLLNNIYENYVDNGSKFLISSIIDVTKKYSYRKLFINDFVSFLCSKGLLLGYDSNLVLLDLLTDQINKLPVKFKSVISEYKKLLILKLNKYKEKGWVNKYSRFTYYTCYLYILTALRFLYFVDTILNFQQPTEINNHTVDAFLQVNPYDKGNLRHFIMFLNKKRITFMQISLPYANYKHELYIGISNETQRQLIETCLYNDSINLRNRIIVILMLFYGVTPSEIKSLKKGNFIINKTKSKTNIIFYKHQVTHEMPPIISTLILNYINKLYENFEYMFPGRFFNSSLSISSICRILKTFKITASELHYTAINNAMLNGLYQPALLMKTFGFSCNTATRYYNLIKNIF
jgi:hypothetical protein